MAAVSIDFSLLFEAYILEEIFFRLGLKKFKNISQKIFKPYTFQKLY